MMRKSIVLIVYLMFAGFTAWCGDDQLEVPDYAEYTFENALRMQRSANNRLAPVYAPLAEWIVDRYDLAEVKGIGIDLGSGPGRLILELCQRTPHLYWINADINPHFFPLFYETANEKGFGHRVGAIFADAKRLPFRDNYADAIVSRGSFPFWGDLRLAFGELYRVLKPGGIAFIGRGFPEMLPPKTARAIRGNQGKGKKENSVLNYKPSETAEEINSVMSDLGIKKYRLLLPQPAGSEGVNYGIWIEIKKPN